MIHPALVLRSAKPGDAASITALFLASRRAAMPYVPQVHSDEKTLAWITHVILPGRRVWVATGEDDTDLLGFAVLEGTELQHLYLRPDRQRQGIGSRLLAEVRTAAPETISLQVFLRNTAAITFYTKHGFQLVNTDDGARNEENEPDATYRWTAPRP